MMRERFHRRLLNAADHRIADDIAVPVDLEAALAAEGLYLHLQNTNEDTKEDTDNG